MLAKVAMIELRKVGYTYSPGTVFAQEALRDIDLSINEGEYIALAGPSGSGKSTLAQVLCGLITPTAGEYTYRGSRLTKEGIAGISSDLGESEVGLVFQFPEAQIFEETVEKDVGFGPKNQGIDEATINERVEEALGAVGLQYDKIARRSPFGLSGGEKRLVAIAGILAMKPRVLILDEPTIGLDRAGREHIISVIGSLNTAGKTIVLITHDMNDAVEHAGRLIVLDNGSIVIDGAADDVFSNTSSILVLEKLGLGIPASVRIVLELKKKGVKIDLGTPKIKDTAARIKASIGTGLGGDRF